LTGAPADVIAWMARRCAGPIRGKGTKAPIHMVSAARPDHVLCSGSQSGRKSDTSDQFGLNRLCWF
jgi:hypothetical protein